MPNFASTSQSCYTQINKLKMLRHNIRNSDVLFTDAQVRIFIRNDRCKCLHTRFLRIHKIFCLMPLGEIREWIYANGPLNTFREESKRNSSKLSDHSHYSWSKVQGVSDVASAHSTRIFTLTIAEKWNVLSRCFILFTTLNIKSSSSALLTWKSNKKMLLTAIQLLTFISFLLYNILRLNQKLAFQRFQI